MLDLPDVVLLTEMEHIRRVTLAAQIMFSFCFIVLSVMAGRARASQKLLERNIGVLVDNQHLLEEKLIKLSEHQILTGGSLVALLEGQAELGKGQADLGHNQCAVVRASGLRLTRRSDQETPEGATAFPTLIYDDPETN